MNDDVIADLKQFITPTLSQQLAEQDAWIDEKLFNIDQKIDTVEAKLSQKIEELTEFVTEAIDTSNETAGKQLADHERRLVKLEHAAA